MSNLGRILTIRVKITDPEAAKWIWDAHMHGSRHGVEVSAIAEGDRLSGADFIEIPKRYYIREEGETTEEAIEAHCYDGFDSIWLAEVEAPKNVSPQSKWDVIDRNGKVYKSGVAP